MIHVITPTDVQTMSPSSPKLFLAGSIEQGKAVNWQAKAIEYYQTKENLENTVIINPRRATWDPLLEQSISNSAFNWQVTFELEQLETADAVIMWLQPETLSPISLLELGLLAGRNFAGDLNRVVVGCPVGFWRRGNVEIVTARYKIPLVNSFEALLNEGYELLRRNHQRRIDFSNLYRIS